jgi:malate permease and related proteins
LSTLLEILINDIVPIFVVIGLGYVFARRTKSELRTLSRLTFYILSPSLVFVSLVESNIAGGEVAQIVTFVVILTATMGVLALATARVLHLSARQTAGFLLVIMFVNTGNYGLGATRLAFGAEAEARAVLYFVTSSVLVYTCGVLIARGGGGGWRGALNQLLRLPHIYALSAALLIRALQWQVPQPILDGLTFPAQAAIPMMLLLLGAQLVNAGVGQYWRTGLTAAGLSLLVAPVVAFGLAGVLGIVAPTRQAVVLEASMPPAVITTLIATEFEAEPKMVTSTVVLATLLSPFTLSVVIALLK